MDATDADGLVPVIPVTYMNSSAAIKGFVGRHGGIVCTSSNARTVLEWAFERGRRVLFFPDQHLGRNTAKAMGVPLEQMPMWNPNKPLGGASAADLLDSRVILWHGFCSVHRRFTVDQIEKARAEHPGVRVIVHPECPMAVVDAADESGSTDYIRRAIEGATEPTTFAIGTEVNLVQRLAADNPQHTIFCLDPVVCPCSTMYRIHPGYLAWVLDGLVEGAGAQPHHRAGGCRRARSPRPRAHARGEAPGRVARGRRRLGARVMTAPEVIVVGSGIAGLVTALHAVDHGCRVTLVTKDVLEHANTRYAQGGIAGVMFDDDRVEDHIRDTLTAGAGLNDPVAVRVLAEEGPARIRELVDLGVAFDRDAQGAFVKGLEAAHSYPRILHSGGDATGTAIEKALVARLRASVVRVVEHAFLVDLVVRDERVRGVELLVGDGPDQPRPPRDDRGRCRRARDGRRRRALCAHHQPAGRDGRRHRGRPARRRGRVGPGVLPVPPDGAGRQGSRRRHRRRRVVPRVRGRPRRGRHADRRARPPLRVRRASRRRARTARHRRPRDRTADGAAGRPSGVPRCHDAAADVRRAPRVPRPPLPDDRPGGARARPGLGARAHPRHPCGALPHGRCHHRPASDARRCPGCTPWARSLAPASTARTGWPPTRCSRAPCSAPARAT